MRNFLDNKGVGFFCKNNLNKLAFLRIDVNNHLLPLASDNDLDFERSVSMIATLANLGIKEIVFTPQIRNLSSANLYDQIDKNLEILKLMIYDRKIRVRVAISAEYEIDEWKSTLDIKRLRALPGGYLLFTMSLTKMPKNLFSVIREITGLGLIPLLAHPERYWYLQNTTETYARIKELGCAMQLNLLSLTRYYGEQTKANAMRLLDEEMYDFAGTDIRNENQFKLIASLLRRYPVDEMLGHVVKNSLISIA